MKKAFVIVVGLLLLAAPAFAADVDGKWTGTVSTPMGDLPVQDQFKADGTTSDRDNARIRRRVGPDQERQGRGRQDLVHRDIRLGGMTLDLSYTGVVSASEIKMTGDFMGMPFEFTVKKA